MTATIDKKVVEMAFENSQFEQNVGKSLSTIDRLKKALNFSDSAKSFDGISQSASRVNLGSLGDAANNVGLKFSAMGILAITTLVNIANAAYQAGARLVKALTIDPITTGLNEYETKLNSVQTILANTQKEGTNLETVTKALNELNTYSDKTIYNFQQMARNVGTFTAAGVKLDTSVAAIKGIANLAAVSGSNAEQASTAMYQLSQALSTGTVRLMDWNSVVNAGMGGQVFQDALVETARVHGVAVDQIIKDEGSFRNSLQRGWLTSEVLAETLQKFTGDLNADQLRTMGYSEEQIASIIALGKTANDAATKVKTFTQLFDTLKEAAQSGWAQTWELVIGDFNEAKSFLTDLNNWFGGMIGASANARNAIIKGWKDLGGRTKLIEAFEHTLNIIIGIINPIKEAFKEFFPPTTAQQLFNITSGLAAFAEKIKMAVEGTDRIKRIFRGVFAVFDIVRIAVVALAKQFGILVGSFSDTGDGLAELIARFGDWLVKLRDAIKQSDVFTTIFSNIANVIGPLLHGVLGFFSALINGFKSTDKVTKSNSFANFLSELGEKFKAFGKLGIIISKVLELLSKVAEKIGPIVAKIGEKLGDLANHALDAMTRGLDKLDTGKILDFLNKGLLGGVLVSLTTFINKSKSIVGGGLFAGILLSVKNFIDEGGSVFKGVSGILDSVKGSLQAYQKSLKANTLLKIAGAIALLAASIIALTLVDQNKLVNATAVIGAMFVGLTSTLDVFEKSTDGGRKLLVMTASLIGISSSLLILSGAILILSKLDPKEALQGVAAVGAILGLLLLFQKFSSGSKGLAGATLGLIGLSVALLGLNIAIKSFGGMETDVLEKGLLGMAAALTIVGVAMNTMNTSIAGAASLLIASAAIMVLSGALKMVGSLSLEEIGLGLLAIAGVLTVLGVAGALLTPVAPTIVLIAISLLAISVSATALGVAIAAVGIGLGALAVGIVTLAGLSGAGIAALTLVITGLASLMPMLATQIVKAITAFLVELAKSIPKVIKAMQQIALALLKGFVGIAPQFVAVVLDLIGQLLAALLTKQPEIIEAGYQILIGFLKGIRDNIGEITTVSIQIITEYLKAVTAQLPSIIDSGWKLIISFVDGMTKAVDDHLPVLIDSVQKLGWAIVEGVLKGLISSHASAKEGIAKLGQILIDGFKENLGIHSPSSVFAQLAAFIVDGLVQGIIQNAFKAVSEIVKMGVKIVDALKGKYNDMLTAGKNLVTGFANGITQYVSNAVKAAGDLARAVLATVAKVFDSHSPSKKMIEQGKFVDQGLAGGISKFASLILFATKDLGKDTVNEFSNIVSRISDAINSDPDFNPTITPVLDLTNFKNGGSQISSMLGTPTLNLATAATQASWIGGKKEILDQKTTSTDTPKTKGDVIFTQNNYSPTELSRIEIYRQTKNQLLQAKGLVGA